MTVKETKETKYTLNEKGQKMVTVTTTVTETKFVNPTTRIYMLVDASGSMVPERQNTLNSINEYVKTVKKEQKEDTDILFNLYYFNSYTGYSPLNNQLNFYSSNRNILHLSNPIKDKNIKDINYIGEDYRPDGGTPLYDAIWEVISKAKFHNDDKIMVIIVTDGEENTSRKTAGEIKSEIETLQFKKDNPWYFTYIGANQDAWQEGSKFGMLYDNTMTYDMGNMKFGMNAMATRSALYASGTCSADLAYTDDERKKAVS